MSRIHHRWDVTPQEAEKIQLKVSELISEQTHTLSPEAHLIAGAHVAYAKHSDRVCAAIVVFDLRSSTVLEEATYTGSVNFPYIPGLLAFREGPPLLEAWEKLKTLPDVVLFEGHGLAHPLRFGLATHLGLWLEVPTIGCAKTLLIGSHEKLGNERGDTAHLVDSGEQVGVALRTKKNVRPVFVSVGFRIDLANAVDLVMRSTRGFRMPEPLRQASIASLRLRYW